VKLQQAIGLGAARPVKGAFEWLEPRAVKVACAVLRGLGGSNALRLPDHPTWLIGDDFDCSEPETVTNGDGFTPDPPSG